MDPKKFLAHGVETLRCNERRLFFTFTDFIGFITIGFLAIFAQVAFMGKLGYLHTYALDFLFYF